MKKLVAVLAALAIIGASAYVSTVYLPSLSNGTSAGYGTMNIYLADPPPQNATLRYLLINVTSLTLKYSSNVTASSSTTTTSSTNSTTTSTSTAITASTSTGSESSQTGLSSRYTFSVPPNLGTNVNLTSLQGAGLLLGSPKVPAGNVTGIIMNITGAEAFWTTGGSTQLKVVADGKLMINTHFTVQADGTTNLTVNVSPGGIHVSPGQASVLRPVVIVTAVSSGPQGSQTAVATESFTETNTTS